MAAPSVALLPHSILPPLKFSLHSSLIAFHLCSFWLCLYDKCLSGIPADGRGAKKSHFEVSSRLYVFYLFFFILPLCLCCSYPTFLFNFRDFFAPFFLLLSFLFSTVSVSLSFRYWELVDKLFPPDAAVFSLLKELSLPSFFPVCVHETPSPAFVPSVFLYCYVTGQKRESPGSFTMFAFCACGCELRHCDSPAPFK